VAEKMIIDEIIYILKKLPGIMEQFFLIKILNIILINNYIEGIPVKEIFLGSS